MMDLDELFPPEDEILEDGEVTYWIFKAEEDKEGNPLDDVYTRAGGESEDNVLKKSMVDRFKIYPVNVDGGRLLYVARFEIASEENGLQHSDAIFIKEGTVKGFVDFLCGFPIESPELLVMVGEMSSRTDYANGKLPVKDASGDTVSPPFPNELFGGYLEEKYLMNIEYLDSAAGLTLANNLSGEPDVKGLHWWVRTNFLSIAGLQFPYPTEFLGLGVRIMVDRPWGHQESNPFIFSGVWLDTVYLTSGFVKTVNPPTDDIPYPTYDVFWRKELIENVRPSDFSEIKEGDRVFLLKDVETDKKSQCWDDDDMKEGAFDKEKWVIVPLAMYDIDPEVES